MLNQKISFDEYFLQFPSETQEKLQLIRKLVKELVPEAIEGFSYGIPTFDYKGKHLIHFAGYKAHIGVYPTATGVSKFESDLSPYKTAKGTIQLPLNKEIPFDLLKKIVEFRKAEIDVN